MSSRDNRLVIKMSSNAKIENYKNVNYNTQLHNTHCSKEKDTTEHAINCEVVGQNMKAAEVCIIWKLSNNESSLLVK